MTRANFCINYRLRDWLISRQRYWGAPIPIVYCEKCGEVPVPESDLPVKLPYDVDFTPDGTSPLLKSESFMQRNLSQVRRPGKARRRYDGHVRMLVMVLSCATPIAKTARRHLISEWINQMLPVDKYVGGAEHACMHLLYARFFTMALHDMGYVNFRRAVYLAGASGRHT